MRIAPCPDFVPRFASQATSTRAFKMPTPLATALVAMLAALIAACTAAAPAAAAKQTPPATEAPSGKPAGKISPEMVGKLSPIAAFKGRGDGWRIEILALDATQHHVALQWPASGEAASGIARYDGPLNIAREAGPLILNGTLERGGTKRALRIEIRTEPCTDIDGVPRPQRIAIDIDTKTTLRGCGDLAVY